jgi:hypothetical protein
MAYIATNFKSIILIEHKDKSRIWGGIKSWVLPVCFNEVTNNRLQVGKYLLVVFLHVL